MISSLYETDFYAWTEKQAQLLQEGNLQELDITHLIEEITTLGRQERRELENCLGILLGYLLKWDYQPDRRHKGWKSTIREQRRALEKLIAQNPSLKTYLPQAIEDAYESGLDLVVRETPLDYDDLPTKCPYGIGEFFDRDFPVY